MKQYLLLLPQHPGVRSAACKNQDFSSVLREDKWSQRGSPASQPASQQGAGIRTFGSKLSLGTTHLMNDDQRTSEHDRGWGILPRIGHFPA